MKQKILRSIESVTTNIVYNLAKEISDEYKGKTIDWEDDEQLKPIRILNHAIGLLEELNDSRHLKLKRKVLDLEKQIIFPFRRYLKAVK